MIIVITIIRFLFIFLLCFVLLRPGPKGAEPRAGGELRVVRHVLGRPTNIYIYIYTHTYTYILL